MLSNFEDVILNSNAVSEEMAQTHPGLISFSRNCNFDELTQTHFTTVDDDLNILDLLLN